MTDLVIRLIVLGFFVYWSLTLIRPFLSIVVWAVILAVALSPVHKWLAARLGGRRVLASVLFTLVALIVLIGPVAALAASLAETVQDVVSRLNAGTQRIPSPPEFLDSVPVLGERIRAAWVLASTNLEEAFVRYRETLAPIRGAVLSGVSEISFDLLKFVVSIIVAGVLLVPGPKLAEGGRRIVTRLVAPRGEQFVDLAGATIRNVSRGVVGVSVLQTIAIGVVLQVAGVPSAGMLAFVILVLCVVQIGPGLVVIPILIWAWLTWATVPALLLTIVLIPLTLMDNVLKPVLIGHGLPTPTVVIFLGVLGGALTYGMIGLFLGPVVLAVFYDLLVSWTLFGSSTATDQEPARPR